MSGTIGRPRALTNAQVAEIWDWHRTHRTLAQIARQYGVSVGTIRQVVLRQGGYKQLEDNQNAAASSELASKSRAHYLMG